MGVELDGGSDPLSLDTVFELLSTRQRRLLLYELRDEGHVELEELARRVADREAEGSASVIRVERVATRLHHQDLPKLHDLRVIEYDERQGDVSCSTYFPLVEKYLDLAEDDEQR